MIALLYGLLDSSVWIVSFWSGAENTSYFSLYYFIAVPCKAFAFCALMRTFEPRKLIWLLPFASTIVITSFISAFYWRMDLDGMTTALGTLLNDAALRSRLGAAGPAHAGARVAPGVVLPNLERLLAECRSQVAA